MQVSTSRCFVFFLVGLFPSGKYPFSPLMLAVFSTRHAEAMKKMMGMVVGATGGQLDVKYYMLVFLKFIQVGGCLT